MLRKGKADNVMIFPDNDYSDDSFTFADGKYQFVHKAIGADRFRYSWNFGQNWTTWKDWEDTTTIDANVFDIEENWWDGAHIMVQCE